MFFFLFHARSRNNHGVHGLASLLQADKRIDIDGLDQLRADGRQQG